MHAEASLPKSLSAASHTVHELLAIRCLAVSTEWVCGASVVCYGFFASCMRRAHVGPRVARVRFFVPRGGLLPVPPGSDSVFRAPRASGSPRRHCVLDLHSILTP